MSRLARSRVVVFGALVAAACGSGSPAAPTATSIKPAVAASGGSARASNSAPILILKTRPAADKTTTPYPTIQGLVPLSVRFNLCPSDDVDQIYLPDGTQSPLGDSLNWQFNFGDYNSVLVANPGTGKFQWDIDKTCRVDHVYDQAGSYLATLAVTDEHQEDQNSRDAVALARTLTKVRINVFPIGPPEPPAPSNAAPVILTFVVTQTCQGTATWTTANATSVTFNGTPGLPPNGSGAQTNNSYSCTLTAIGPGGSSPTQTLVCNNGC